MKTTHFFASTVLLGSALITGATDLPGQDKLPPRIPAEPHDQPVRVIRAQRFEVARPFAHVWRVDRPMVKSGWLLVLSVPPELVHPRQAHEPVLYVGAQTANRVNPHPYESGKMVVIVPGDFLLEDSPIFFGAPALPEEVGPSHIDKEVARARDAGVRPPSVDNLATVVVAEVLRVATEYDLRQRAIDLVEKYSPQEKDLIAGERVPLVR